MEKSATIENEVMATEMDEIRDATVALGAKATSIGTAIARNKKLYSGEQLKQKNGLAIKNLNAALEAYTEILKEFTSPAIAGLYADIESAAAEGDIQSLKEAVNGVNKTSQAMEAILQGLKSLEKMCDADPAMLAVEFFRDRLIFAGEQAQKHITENLMVQV